jgi:hypothetical protein
LAYLQKTEHVVGPRRDLIHLEGAGALTGLDPAVADDLEELAINGLTSEAVRRIRRLESAPAQVAALRHIAHVTRELSVGIEGRNGVATLIAAVGAVPDLDLTPAANELAAAVSAHVITYELRPADLPGAFLLGLRTPFGAAVRLVRDVLSRDELLTDESLGNVVVEHLSSCLPEHTARVAALLAARIAAGDERAIHALKGLEVGELKGLLGSVREPLKAALAPAAADDEEAEAVPDPTNAADSLNDLASQLAEGGRRQAAVVTLDVLLEIDHQRARDHAERLLPMVAPIVEDDVVPRVLAAARRRVTRLWPDWLGHIEPTHSRTPASVQELRALASTLWERRLNNDENTDTASLHKALESLGSLGPARTKSIEEEIAAQLAALAPNEAAAQAMVDRLGLAELFASFGFVELDAIAADALTALQRLLSVQLPIQSPDAAMTSFVVTAAPLAATVASTDERLALSQALEDSVWLASPAKEMVLITVAARRLHLGDEVPSPIGAAQLRALVEGNPGVLEETVARWIESFAAPQEVAGLLELDEIASSARVERALARADSKAPGTGWQVLQGLLSRVPAFEPKASVLRALRADAANDEDIADALVAAYERAGNNAEREIVLRVWRAVGPTDSKARRALIERVFVPLFQGSKGGLQLAAKNLDVALPPPYGLTERLRTALLDAARTFEIEREVRRVMEDRGLLKRHKRRWPFSR